jgi:hypothetical protein
MNVIGSGGNLVLFQDGGWLGLHLSIFMINLKDLWKKCELLHDFSSSENCRVDVGPLQGFLLANSGKMWVKINV